MWITTLMLLTIGLADGGTTNHASPLLGTWTEIDGPGAARIEPCRTSPGRLCAIGLARRGAGQAERVDAGMVLSGLELEAPNRWRGRYRHGNRWLPATVRLISPRVVEMKVCILMFCQSARYARSA